MRVFDLKHPQVELSDTISYISQLDFVKVKTKYASDGWSALSLQGYGYNSSDILKPNVLGSKTEIDYVVETDLYDTDEMKPIREIINVIPSVKERIRLMKLSAGCKIKTHTDKVDKDFVRKRIVRIHIPITDNKHHVEYKLWDKGRIGTYTWDIGSYYYLDVSQRHSVDNYSDDDRINIVADVIVNDKIRSLLNL